jgi:hypothetical protein
MLRRFLPLLLVAVLAIAALAGCGSSKTTGGGGSAAGGGGATPAVTAPATGAHQKVHFAKTKFVIHAGLAFGVFHHWIYNPYKQGKLSHPLSHKLAFTKALIAGAIVIHEVKLALADARHSKILSKVVLPLAAVATSVAAIRSALQHHKVDSAAMNTANSNISTAHAESSAAGQPIRETSSAPGL